MRTNFILIDYENVQPRSFAEVDQEYFRVFIFAGANQTKVPIETAAAVQPLGKRAEYIRITTSAPDALDFLIASRLGELANGEPDAFFHIISKDRGFDPLIEHYASRGIRVLRSESLEDIPLLKVTRAKTLPERVGIVVEKLRRPGQGKPRRLNALRNAVTAIFQRTLSEGELDELLEALKTRGFVAVDSDCKVSYALPEKEAAV